MGDEKVKFSAFVVQSLATFAIAYLTTLTGIVFAWPSYTLQNFASNETVLSWPMSTSEVSMLGSVTNIGGLVVTPFCGYAVDNLGRKYSAMLFGVPLVLAWTIIASTNYVPLVIASMALAGVGGAGQVVSSVYIAEICQDSIRGALTSSLVSGYFLGLMASYIMGGQLTYYQVVYTHLTLSVLYIVMLMALKESPVFLMQRKKEKEAAQSIAFYRQVDVTSKEVEVEIRKIKLQLDPRLERILHGENEEMDQQAMKVLLDNPDQQKQPVSPWRFLMNSESSKRALFTAVTLMGASITMGALILQVYAEPLFKEAVPSMPSNTCAILLALDLLVASLLCAAIVDRFGRKFLMKYSSLGSGLIALLLATQLQIHFAPPWVTALLIYSYCFVYNIGAAPVPFVVTAEVFLPEVRGLCNSITMASLWITSFVTLVIFNPLVENFGLGPLFYGFACMCFLTALYSHFCLPETKGLSADAIQLLFLKKEKKIKNVCV